MYFDIFILRGHNKERTERVMIEKQAVDEHRLPSVLVDLAECRWSAAH